MTYMIANLQKHSLMHHIYVKTGLVHVVVGALDEKL